MEGIASLPTRGKFWTTSPLDELPLRVGDSGLDAEPPTTVMSVFKKRVQESSDSVRNISLFDFNFK